MKVLVVDDNVDSAESLAMLLEALGHSTNTAPDGIDALEQAKTDTPDAIILDIGLPGMNGYEVARALRQQPHGESVRLIALTGYGDEKDRELSQEAGFDHHLVKPVALEELQEVLHP